MWLWNFLLTCSDCFCFLVHPHYTFWYGYTIWIVGFMAFIPPSFSISFLSFHKLWINLLWLHSEKFLCLSHSAFLFAICSWIFHIISQYNLNKHLISCSFCLSFFVWFLATFFFSLSVAVWIWSPFMSIAFVGFLMKFMDRIFNKEEIDQNIHSIWIEIEILGCNDENVTLYWILKNIEYSFNDSWSFIFIFHTQQSHILVK